MQFAHLNWQNISRFFGIISVPLAGVLVQLYLAWTWNNSPVLMEMSISLVPVSFIFALWLHTLEKSGRLAPHFSPVFACITVAAFSMVDTPYRPNAIWVGMLAGLFISVDIKAFFLRACAEPALAAVALVAMAACRSYFVIQHYLWKEICQATGHVAYFFLHLINSNIWIDNGKFGRNVRIGSDHFSIAIYNPCSGLQGMALFTFLLSVMVMIDWQRFKHRHLLDLYMLGFLYMFMFNVLRICLFFLLGDWANRRDAGPFAASFRGTALEMFHSSSGWVLYLIAFGAFMACVYKVMAYEKVKPGESEENKA